MADHTITITNTMFVYGYEPTTRWGTLVYGTDRWAYGYASHEIGKEIANTATADSTASKAVDKPIDNSVTADSDVAKDFNKAAIENSLTVTSDPESEYLADAAGYRYVFPRPSTNAENRATNTFTTASQATTSYSCASVTSTTWS